MLKVFSFVVTVMSRYSVTRSSRLSFSLRRPSLWQPIALITNNQPLSTQVNAYLWTTCTYFLKLSVKHSARKTMYGFDMPTAVFFKLVRPSALGYGDSRPAEISICHANAFGVYKNMHVQRKCRDYRESFFALSFIKHLISQQKQQGKGKLDELA